MTTDEQFRKLYDGMVHAGFSRAADSMWHKDGMVVTLEDGRDYLMTDEERAVAWKLLSNFDPLLLKPCWATVVEEMTNGA